MPKFGEEDHARAWSSRRPPRARRRPRGGAWLAGSLISFWRFTQPSTRDEHVVVLGDDQLLCSENSAPRPRLPRSACGASRPCRARRARSRARRGRCPSGPWTPPRRAGRGSLGALALVLELLLDHEDLEARQPIELELEDGVGLLLVELELLHDLLRCVGLALGRADRS